MKEAAAADIFGMYASSKFFHLVDCQTSIGSLKDSKAYHAFIVFSTIIMNQSAVVITSSGVPGIFIFFMILQSWLAFQNKLTIVICTISLGTYHLLEQAFAP